MLRMRTMITRCLAPRRQMSTDKEVASGSVEKILNRWSNLDQRVTSALKRPRRRPTGSLVPGRRRNRPNRSEEEVRWRMANPGEDLNDTPTWGETEYETVGSTLLQKVARVSTVTIKHGKADELVTLYDTELKKMYNALDGVESAQLMLNRAAGTAQSVTIWSSREAMELCHAAPSPEYNAAMSKLVPLIESLPEIQDFECSS
eukprot:TRINITY_DN44533_c0_g1_i1.p1 TRINITY_DN44533_c0_g1~~TRINITY_DN44533_c0_g1_i1.p1  ORF type:complete len:203 (-),score=43.64 TRINITY_DN44533_c0_g1_i1:48-656(-)